MLIVLLILILLLGGGGGYYGYRGGYYGAVPFGGIGLVLLLIAVWLLLDTPAWPADGTTIQAAPFYKEYVEPVVASIIASVILGLFGWLLSIAQAHISILRTQTALNVEAQARDIIQTAATNGAGRIAAKAEGPLANISLDVRSQAVANEVRIIEPKIGEQLKKINISPDQVESTIGDLVVAKFGILQAGTPAAITNPAQEVTTIPSAKRTTS